MKHTENEVALKLFYHLSSSFYMMVPRACIHWAESDLLGIRSSFRTDTYEIKVTRSDFRADMKKTHWHQFLRQRTGRIPNRFWYAAPVGIIPPEEVPEYAGLIELDFTPPASRKTPTYFERKPAPVLHKGKLSQHSVNSLCRTCGWRYWSLLQNQNQWLTRREQEKEYQLRISASIPIIDS